MASGAEIITLQFKPDLAGIQQAENHLQALAARFHAALATAYAGAANGANVMVNVPQGRGGIGGGGGGGGAGGGGAGGAPNPGGAPPTPGGGPPPPTPTPADTNAERLAAIAKGAARGFGSGINSMSPMTSPYGSPGATALAGGFGAVEGAIGAAGAAFGPLGAVGGALAVAQFRAFERDVRAPIEKTGEEVADIVGSLERHGISVSDESIRGFVKARNVANRREYEGKKRAYRLSQETGVIWGSLSSVLSGIGL